MHPTLIKGLSWITGIQPHRRPRHSFPRPSPFVGRWECIIDGEKYMVGGWRCISFLAHLGCNIRGDFPDEGQVDNPSSRIGSISWKYLPYTRKEIDDYWKEVERVREMVDRSQHLAEVLK